MHSFLSNLVWHLQSLSKNLTQISKMNSSYIKLNFAGLVDPINYSLIGIAYLLACQVHY